MPETPKTSHGSHSNSSTSIGVKHQTLLPTIEIWQHITREDLRQNQDKIFLFGDNLTGRGFGGQAKEMRGEENAIGIPTKKAPSNHPSSFFSDKELAKNEKAINAAFGKIPKYKTIVIPQAGLGTGLARLSEKAPRTAQYLNQKFAEIGYDNVRGKPLSVVHANDQRNLNAENVPKPSQLNENKVVVPGSLENQPTARRLLDLNNIQTANLRLLSPTETEVKTAILDRKEALANYADRLREDYKGNKDGLQDGLRLLSDSVEKGELITISCSCRNGEMCHADVVKMAIEKVNLFVKSKQIQEADQIRQSEKPSKTWQDSIPNSRNLVNEINPRTQRAINEILAVSETDRLLGKLDQTDGRSRAEHSSYLGSRSQFVRDLYERGGNVIGGNLIVPSEKLSDSKPLEIITQGYAAERISKILGNESKAKEIAPTIVDYGNKIAGVVTDAETKLKVFSWIYDSLEGKTEFIPSNESREISGPSDSKEFDETLDRIAVLAEEMQSLEPVDRIELVSLSGFEQREGRASGLNSLGEDLDLEAIYETAVNLGANERSETFLHQQSNEIEHGGKLSTEGFERFELSNNVPQLPGHFTRKQIDQLLSKTLPEIDRKLESGQLVKEILKPFNEFVWQSAKDDALNNLEKIYRVERIADIDSKLSDASQTLFQKKDLENERVRWSTAILTPTQESNREFQSNSRDSSGTVKPNPAETATTQTTVPQHSGNTNNVSQSVRDQLEKIDLRRQNVIELKNPGEFRKAEELAISTFFKKSKLEIGKLLTKLDEIQEKTPNAGDKSAEQLVKKELSQIKESRPSFAFKLDSSGELIVGAPSITAINERNFVSSYISFQLKQPETRLRHDSDRYRVYAAKLENVSSKDELIKTASEIRSENASIGLNWKDLETSEKVKLPRPLTSKEMQFLFTESSPAHFSTEMTAIRLSYSHAGASRRLITESLIRGEIKPSPEALKLINSLESRLARRELKDSISATRHFFESIKTPNDLLKYKNQFDHSEIYRSLPPQERDFVYYKATEQKDTLETRLAFNHLQSAKEAVQNRSNQNAQESFLAPQRLDAARTKVGQDYSQAEKLASLRDSIKSDIIDSLQKNPEVDIKNSISTSTEVLQNNLAKAGFTHIAKDSLFVNSLSHEINESIEAKKESFVSERNGSAAISEIALEPRDFDSIISRNDRTIDLMVDRAKEPPSYTR